MNKKTIIIIISIIAALAIVIGGTVALLSSKFKGTSDKDNNNQNSITSSSTEGTNSNDNSQNGGNTDSFNSNETDTNENDSTVSVPKANKDMTTFIVDNVTAEKGGKVSVPVYVSSNKGFMGVFGKIKYDTSALKYTGYKKGNILTDYEVQETNGEIKFMSVERGDVTKDGVVLYLQFDVVTASTNTTPITISIADNAIANKAEQYVKVDTINGSVKIK